MKNSTLVLLSIGILLIFMQLLAYKGNDFQFPPLYKIDAFETAPTLNIGTIIGFNFFGLLGLILIIIGTSRKSKSKSK